jgi:alpha-tubulin suppressor-like RCC1 family protein
MPHRRIAPWIVIGLLACSDGSGPSGTEFFLGAVPATGVGFQCALLPAGSAYCWGENQYGQTGTGLAASEVVQPTAVAGDVAFDTLVAGVLHVCGLTAEGAAHCWGGPGGPGISVYTPVPVGPHLRFSVIAAGDWQTCGVAADARAYCWTAIGTAKGPAWVPRPVPGTANLISVATAYNSSCGLDTSGEVACWGTAVARYIPGDDNWEVDYAVKAPAGPALETINTGASHVCGFADGEGTLRCIGMNLWGEIGDGSQEPRREWAPVDQPEGGFSAISLSLWRSSALDREGRLWIWGKPGPVDELVDATPRMVVPDVRWAAFDVEYLSYCGITMEGRFGCLSDWDTEGNPGVTFAPAPDDAE